MRKIAANYILLPGFELVRNGYVVIEGGQVADVVDTGGKIQEIACLEFYGGMIVADFVREQIVWNTGDNIRDRILALYGERNQEWKGIALLQGADFAKFLWLPGTQVLQLR